MRVPGDDKICNSGSRQRCCQHSVNTLVRSMLMVYLGCLLPCRLPYHAADTHKICLYYSYSSASRLCLPNHHYLNTIYAFGVEVIRDRVMFEQWRYEIPSATNMLGVRWSTSQIICVVNLSLPQSLSPP